MKKNKLLIMVVIIFAIIAISLVTICIIKHKNLSLNKHIDNSVQEVIQEEKQKEIQEEKELDKIKNIKGLEQLKVKGISIAEKDDGTYVDAIIKNVSDELIESNEIIITIYNKSGDFLLKSGALIDDIEPSGEIGIQFSTTVDLTDAYSYTAELPEKE